MNLQALSVPAVTKCNIYLWERCRDISLLYVSKKDNSHILLIKKKFFFEREIIITCITNVRGASSYQEEFDK